MKKLLSASSVILFLLLTTQSHAIDPAENRNRLIAMVNNIVSITNVCGSASFVLMQEEGQKNGQSAAYAAYKTRAETGFKAARSFATNIGLPNDKVSQQTTDATSQLQAKLATPAGRNEVVDLEKKCSVIFANFQSFIDQEYKKYGVEKEK